MQPLLPIHAAFVEDDELQMKGNVGLMMGKSERDGSPLAYSEAISRLTWLSAFKFKLPSYVECLPCVIL